MITKEQIDEIKLVVAGAGKIDETRPQFKLLCQLAEEHAAMREALRYRAQWSERAPENEMVIVRGKDGWSGIDRGCFISSNYFWLPIPPLNKEQP
jgi:hypothetical protein